MSRGFKTGFFLENGFYGNTGLDSTELDYATVDVAYLLGLSRYRLWKSRTLKIYVLNEISRTLAGNSLFWNVHLWYA